MRVDWVGWGAIGVLVKPVRVEVCVGGQLWTEYHAFLFVFCLGGRGGAVLECRARV